jgi:hypothetical protein
MASIEPVEAGPCPDQAPEPAAQMTGNQEFKKGTFFKNPRYPPNMLHKICSGKKYVPATSFLRPCQKYAPSVDMVV